MTRRAATVRGDEWGDRTREAYRRFNVRFLSFKIFVLPFFETVIVLVFGAELPVVVL